MVWGDPHFKKQIEFFRNTNEAIGTKHADPIYDVKKRNRCLSCVSFSPPDSEPKKDQKAPAQDSAPTKPVQSVAPQTRDSSGFSAWESGTDRLVNLWDSSADGPESQNSQSSNLVDLMGDAAILPGNSAKPQPLLSFDDMIEGSMCSATGPEDDPTSLVDVMAEDQMTLSYQHALQHASGEKKELLMTNGETQEGTQVRQVNNASDEL